MGHVNWVRINVMTHFVDMVIQNAYLDWGKFHKDGDKDQELSVSEINGTVVSSSVIIASCGRYFSATGVEGGFEIHHKGVNIGTLRWNCPYSGDNYYEWEFAKKEYEKTYPVMKSDCKKDGNLGNKFISIAFYP